MATNNSLNAPIPFAVAKGGTGISSGTSGGVPYFNSTSTIASSGALTANQIVLGGGASGPAALGSLGTVNTVLHGNAGGAPSFSAVSLTADVSGILPATSGGTGQNAYTVGDLLYANTTTTLAKLADVATGNALISGGVGVAPSWGQINLTTTVSGILPQGNGGTGANASLYGANQVIFQNSGNTAFTSSSALVYSTNLTLTSGAFAGATADGDKLLLVGLSTASKIAHAAGWDVQMYAGMAPGGGGNAGQFSWFVENSLGTAFSKVMGLTFAGLNLPNLTATRLVQTDASQNLISAASGTATQVLHGNLAWSSVSLTADVSGILPIANGGTNQSAFATPVSGLNPIPFFNGTSFTSTSKFGFDPVFDIINIKSNNANPQIGVFTSITGSGNSASHILSRGDQANGGTFEYHQTGATSNWQIGMYPGSANFVFGANSGIAASVLTLSNTTGDVTVNTGNLNVSNLTASRLVQTDASKNLSSVASGTATQVLHGNLAWSAVSLTTDVTGTLPVTNGGTGTGTAFTQGSVVFAGASGVYSQNNSAFFWDNTNTKLSVQGSSNNLVLLQSSAAATFVPVLTILAPNLSNQTVTIDIGFNDRSGPTLNTGYIGFNYVSFVSPSNALVLGINQTATTADNLLTIAGTGDVTATKGNLIFSTAIKGLQFTHAAVSAGTANGTLVTGVVTTSGTVTINNSAITTSYFGIPFIITRNGTTSYVVVTCGNGSFRLDNAGLDTSTYGILFIKSL